MKFKNGLLLASMLGTVAPLSAEVFLEASTGWSVHDRQNEILGGQPIAELVGGDSKVNEIKVGVGSLSSNMPTSQLFLFVNNAEAKNDEWVAGFGAKFISGPIGFNNDFVLSLGAKLGFITQFVEGKEVSTSTSANKVSYITGSTINVPTTVKFEDDTVGLSIALNLGTAYKISRNLTWNVEASYLANHYQVAYRNANAPGVLNAMTFKQDNYVFNTGLSFYF